jgi:transporter family-2 protein
VNESIWISVVIALGVAQALQVSLLGAMSQARGPAEAAFISILGTAAGLAVALALRGVIGPGIRLPAPFNNPMVIGVIAVAAALLLMLSLRGLPAVYAMTGMGAVPFLLSASILAPRIGVGLFLAAFVAGQMGGGVLLDHLGAFGAAVRPVDAPRLLGIAALMLGVILVRGMR